MNSPWLLNPVKCVNNLSTFFGVVPLESRWNAENVCEKGILRCSSNLLQMSSSYVCVFREISSSPVLVETAMSPSPSDAALHWFSFSKADLFTGWTFSGLSIFHEKIKGTASAFNRFLIEYGLITSSDVKCSLQISVWRLTLKYRGSLFIFVIQMERRLLESNGNPWKERSFRLAELFWQPPAQQNCGKVEHKHFHLQSFALLCLELEDFFYLFCSSF